ncbi:serine/arginine repetitive matrix protein 5-like [Ambystoma mexicanum]|uniref:serine/arginine repetitive matrix protein 5-like n=1 Tax=Ambystoma mexicanum TaxID=8296 RepID=UPI0037E8869D
MSERDSSEANRPTTSDLYIKNSNKRHINSAKQSEKSKNNLNLQSTTEAPPSLRLAGQLLRKNQTPQAEKNRKLTSKLSVPTASPKSPIQVCHFVRSPSEVSQTHSPVTVEDFLRDETSMNITIHSSPESGCPSHTEKGDGERLPTNKNYVKSPTSKKRRTNSEQKKVDFSPNQRYPRGPDATRMNPLKRNYAELNSPKNTDNSRKDGLNWHKKPREPTEQKGDSHSRDSSRNQQTAKQQRLALATVLKLEQIPENFKKTTLDRGTILKILKHIRNLEDLKSTDLILVEPYHKDKKAKAYLHVSAEAKGRWSKEGEEDLLRKWYFITEIKRGSTRKNFEFKEHSLPSEKINYRSRSELKVQNRPLSPRRNSPQRLDKTDKTKNLFSPSRKPTERNLYRARERQEGRSPTKKRALSYSEKKSEQKLSNISQKTSRNRESPEAKTNLSTFAPIKQLLAWLPKTSSSQTKK